MTTYTTAAGRTVTTDKRTNAFDQTVYAFECDGCDGLRGFNNEAAAESKAREHAAKCTTRPEESS